jgi:hypothetical protein
MGNVESKKMDDDKFHKIISKMPSENRSNNIKEKISDQLIIDQEIIDDIYFEASKLYKYYKTNFLNNNFCERTFINLSKNIYKLPLKDVKKTYNDMNEEEDKYVYEKELSIMTDINRKDEQYLVDNLRGNLLENFKNKNIPREVTRDGITLTLPDYQYINYKVLQLLEKSLDRYKQFGGANDEENNENNNENENENYNNNENENINENENENENENKLSILNKLKKRRMEREQKIKVLMNENNNINSNNNFMMDNNLIMNNNKNLPNKPIQQLPGKTEKLPNKPIQQLPGKTNKLPNKPIQQLPGKTEKLLNKPIQQLPGKTEKLLNKPIQQLPGKTEKLPNKPIQQLPGKTEKLPNKPIQQLPSKTEELPNKPIQQLPGKTNKIPNNHIQELPSKTEKLLNKPNKQISVKNNKELIKPKMNELDKMIIERTQGEEIPIKVINSYIPMNTGFELKTRCANETQSCLLTKREMCEEIAKHFIVRGNIIASILSIIPIKEYGKYEGSFPYQRLKSLIEGKFCLPKYDQIVNASFNERIIKVLKFCNIFDEKKCIEVGGLPIKLSEKQMKEIMSGDEFNSKYLLFANRLNNNYRNGLRELQNILKILSSELPIHNMELNNISMRVKEIIDNIYIESQLNYLLALLVLLDIKFIEEKELEVLKKNREDIIKKIAEIGKE